MRIDVEPENDSGGFSLLASAAVPAMVADQRSDDGRFVRERTALLFSLVGDDDVRVRVLVDEAPDADEAASVLSRVVGLLDLRCGQLLVCGGFDPRNLEDWADGGDDDYVAPVAVPPGWYRVEVGATLGCGNGLALASGGEEAYLANDELDGEIPEDAPSYGWLVVLRAVPAGTLPPDLSELPDDGWYEVDAGALDRGD